MNRYLFILMFLIILINPVNATTGLIAYSPTTYDIGQYGHVLVSLSGGDFGSYTYFIEQRNPSNVQTETGQIFADGTYTNDANYPFDLSGTWTVNIYSCGYGDCNINKQILDNATATITGNITPSMIVTFQTVGQGQFYVFKNGQLEALATPNYSVSVGYVVNDTIGFVAYPYINNYIGSVCDVPYTECKTDSAYSYTVVGQLPEKMIVTFLPTLKNMPVSFQVVGNGQVYIFKNNDMVGLSTRGTNISINYNQFDYLGFQTYPYLNESLISVCDVPYTECNNLTYGNYKVIGQLPEKLIFTFSTNISSGYENRTKIDNPLIVSDIAIGNETIQSIIDTFRQYIDVYYIVGIILFLFKLYTLP